MRWLRLPRRRDPHTAVITGVKSAVRAAQPDQVRSLLATHRKTLGLDARHSQELSAVIAGRVDNSISHDQVSTRLEALGNALSDDTPSEAWFTLENLARTIGCFVASQVFTGRGLAAMRASGNPLDVFRASVHGRDLIAAQAAWESTPRDDSQLHGLAGHYLWLWSGGTAGAPRQLSDSPWSRLLRGRPVTILGPAPTSLTAGTLPPDSLVARVIMQGVLSWEAATDPLGGQCDLAYANRETRNWLRDNELWADLSRFEQVSFRVSQSDKQWASLAPNLRTAADPQPLMIGGSSANMVPLMVWDVLQVPDVSVTVGGTTFFASRTAYTDSNRRFKHTVGKPTDQIGSTGELFERCPTFARHNVTENLNLVANLAHSGAIAVDAECERVVNLDVGEYLAELDALYGIDRR